MLFHRQWVLLVAWSHETQCATRYNMNVAHNTPIIMSTIWFSIIRPPQNTNTHTASILPWIILIKGVEISNWVYFRCISSSTLSLCVVFFHYKRRETLNSLRFYWNCGQSGVTWRIHTIRYNWFKMYNFFCYFVFNISGWLCLAQFHLKKTIIFQHFSLLLLFCKHNIVCVFSGPRSLPSSRLSSLIIVYSISHCSPCYYCSNTATYAKRKQE